MTGESVVRQYAAETSAVSTDESGIPGVLHDLGHQMMTVSMLAETLQSVLPEDEHDGTDARRQAALMVQEAVRAMKMIADFVPPAGPAALPGSGQQQLIDVRELTAELTRLGQLRHAASVRLTAGPPVYMTVNPMLVWRVLTNLVDNAARAAGPDGHVEIRISRAAGTIIEVADDGGGFGSGPGGTGRGLSVVGQLLAATGGELEVEPGRYGGTRARAIFGARCDRIVLPRQRTGTAVIA